VVVPINWDIMILRGWDCLVHCNLRKIFLVWRKVGTNWSTAYTIRLIYRYYVLDLLLMWNYLWSLLINLHRSLYSILIGLRSRIINSQWMFSKFGIFFKLHTLLSMWIKFRRGRVFGIDLFILVRWWNITSFIFFSQ
jgi:hypothetical protein